MFCKTRRKTPVPGLFFNKVAGVGQLLYRTPPDDSFWLNSWSLNNNLNLFDETAFKEDGSTDNIK